MGQARDEAGNIWETDAQGNPVRLIRPAQANAGGVYTIPNPQQDIANSRADTQLELARRAAARAAAADARSAQANERQAREWSATHNPDGSPKKIRTYKPMPDSAAKRYEEEVGAFASLDRAIGGFKDEYAGNTVTGGLENTIQNRFSGFGSPGQAQWWADMTATDNVLRNALFGASLTAGEKSAYEKTTISPSMDPKQVRDNLMRRREIAQQVLARRTNFLKANGYDPDSVDALAGEYAGAVNSQAGRPQNVMEQTYLTQPGLGNAAPFGSTTERQPIPPEMQAEYTSYLENNIGRLDPEDYVRFRQQLDQKYGFPVDPAKAEEYRNWATGAAQKGRTGGDVPVTIPGPNRPMSGVDQIRNNMVSNSLGAAAAGFANMGGFGVPERLAPDQMSALGEAHPYAMGAGQVAGSIAGTGLLGKGGKIGLDAALANAPRLKALAAKTSPFVRNLATDTAYGGVYGGVTENDPLGGAARAAIGSAGGQAGGKLIGKGLAGVKVPAEVLRLRAAGIPMTIGQQVGGMAKSIEDKMTSLPFVGDMVNARRVEGLRAFNKKALDQAGKPVGARVNQIGETGVESLIDQIGNSYDSATAGANVPLDPVFANAMAAARATGQKLPSDFAEKFAKALENRVKPIEDAGTMTGDAYQQAVRGIKGYRAETPKPGFEQDYRDALSLAQDALTAQMQRGGGESVTEGLGRADAAYRQAKTIQNAMKAAKNGTGSGQVQVFTPAQLNTAATKTADKFGGKRPFARLTDDAQTVLPSKIADSGTAGRVMQGALGLGAVGSAGYGAGTGDTTTLAPAALLGLLALGGTKAGQKTLQKLLIDRPDNVRRLGKSVGKKSGLFGSATIPFLLE